MAGRKHHLIPLPARPLAGATGITCIELMLICLYILAIVLGVQYGWNMWTEDGTTWWLIGIAAAVLMAVGLVILGLFALLTPIWLYMAITAALSPADLTCRCAENNTPVPENLLPAAGIGRLAMEDNGGLGRISRISLQPPINSEVLGRLSLFSGAPERIAIAASLGLDLGDIKSEPFAGPAMTYKSWSGLPKDIQSALRSGPPPRLLLEWGIALLERALPVFEKEFHQDTRPRQILGAAHMILQDGNAEAVSLCRILSQATWAPEYYGCRVVHRDLWRRVMDVPTPGHHAALTAYSLSQLAFQYVSPDRLWRVYAPGDVQSYYETPENRILYSQPGWYAEGAAGYAAQAGVDKETEFQWQRDTLARMILGWDRWDEDREAWRARLDGEWIPLIRERLKDVKFDVPAYIKMVRSKLVPWRQTAPAG